MPQAWSLEAYQRASPELQARLAYTATEVPSYERGPDWGGGPGKKSPERIAWHESKSAVIYRLEQRGENASGRGLLSEKFI
ncbi:MAG: hypothetical protein EXS36_03140, partial [Pedosphaera sp.]|nr:hypothetical protein [Pedosphaera sp.]